INGNSKPALGGRFTSKPERTQLKNNSSTRILELSEMLNTRYSAASSPITDCQKYFSRERIPSGSLCTTLRQSSAQPIAPKPKVTSNTIQTKRLDRSAHNRVETAMDSRISTPPMVGVPLLLRWVSMP